MAYEYGTLPALKERLGIEADDTTRDALLTSALASASRSIDRTCGRRFWLDEVAVARVFRPSGRVACGPDGDVLLVDDIGDTAGLVVEAGGPGAWSVLGGWETQPDNAFADGRPVTGLLRPSGWGPGRVRITTRWGWPLEPAEIVEASLIQASRLYKRKDSPEGITGSAEWGVVRLSRRDPDVWNLLEPYVLPGFG